MKKPQFLHLHFSAGEKISGGATLYYHPYENGESAIFVALCSPTEHNFNRKKARKMVLDRVHQAHPNYSRSYKTHMTFQQFRERGERFIAKKVEKLKKTPKRDHWLHVDSTKTYTRDEIRAALHLLPNKPKKVVS